MSRSARILRLTIREEYVTVVNVELNNQIAFEGALRLFKREFNNSNVVNEMRRRRYHEEAWMMRRRKEKERMMKVKVNRNLVSYEDRNPMTVNTIFARDYEICDEIFKNN